MSEGEPQGVPAVVLAGDGEASKSVRGQSKAFLEVGGQPLVSHVVLALQDVPEVSEVWVVGQKTRLSEVLAERTLGKPLRKPLHLVEQSRNLFENAWAAYQGVTAHAGASRSAAERDRPIFYLSGDLPFPSPEELSDFVAKSLALDVDYAFGIVPEHSLQDFLPKFKGEPGIRPAYYNIREGRFRQSNLHLAKPARIGNREAIGEIYRFRYQRNPINVLRVAWHLLRQPGSASLLVLYCKVHLAALCDRWGCRRLADRLRSPIPIGRVEAALSRVLGGSLRFVVTTVGGCAIDIDCDREYDAVCARYEEWRSKQEYRARQLGASLASPGTQAVTHVSAEASRASEAGPVTGKE